MHTIKDIVIISTEYLQKRGVSHPRRQAEELLADVLGYKRLDLYLKFDCPLEPQELDRCREALKRRAKGEPLQYIRGAVEFYGCQISLSPDVIIPRQETEILVDKISQTLSSLSLEGKELWDVCCGSGCIGIALKKKFPQLKVILSDLSEKALAIAKKNGEINQVEIEYKKGDLLTPFMGHRADFIVCNPPYVSEADYLTLDREVKEFEPRAALVGGVSGLEFYECLASQLRDYLVPRGKVWLEIGTGQGAEIIDLFKKNNWHHYCLEKDWAQHDRFFSLENE